MFVLLALMLLGSVVAKQPCPICRDYHSYGSSSRFSSSVRDSCSRAISSSSNSPCPDGEVCKVFNAGHSFSAGYTYYSTTIKQIDCFHPSDSCLSEYPTFRCTEAYLFNPDKCPGCLIAKATIGGVDYDVEDTCTYDSSQWGSCNRGTACNFLKIRGYLDNNYSDTVTIYVLGCGLKYSDCREVESNLESSIPGLRISRCSAYDFPDDWDI